MLLFGARAAHTATMWSQMSLTVLSRILAACAPDTVDRWAGMLGSVAFHLGIRRRVVQENLRIVFDGTVHASRRRDMGRRSYCSIAASLLAVVHWGRRGGAKHVVQVMCPAYMQMLAQRYPAVVLLASHMGVWDLAAATVTRYWPLQAYATPQHNPDADAWINAQREALGIRVLLAKHGDRKGALRALRGLRSGVSLGLLADQGPRRAHGQGGWFLGQAVSCHVGPGFFASRAQVPVVAGVCVRYRAGQYRLYMARPLFPAGDQSEQLNQACLDLVSALVQALPGQYFWHHRRFKYRMPAPPRPYQPWRQWGLGIWAQPQRLLTDSSEHR
ncbi:MAG: hypothetical protein EA401_02315 [Planctomycetota bacterium]|nr:MAG: hypothetical protein EA401_02315 [Planctomycetota bacterium]